MCVASQDTMDKLDKTICQFLDEGRMFTAYDVTLETRQREKMQLKHGELKGSVHECQSLVDALDYGFDQSNGQTVRYTRSQKDMPNNMWAYVYHPVGTDAANYQPRNTSAPAAAAPVANSIAVVNASDSDSGGANSDGTFATDLRNRLCVPTRLLKEIGGAPSKPVFVVPNPSTTSVLLSMDIRAVPQGSATQVIERNGDVRLSSKTLQSADLTGCNFSIGVKEVDVGNNNMVKVVEVTG